MATIDAIEKRVRRKLAAQGMKLYKSKAVPGMYHVLRGVGQMSEYDSLRKWALKLDVMKKGEKIE
jgi:hypothetical protein